MVGPSEPGAGGAPAPEDEEQRAQARKGFLLRLPPSLLAELRTWASAEVRSLNGHIEYLLREAVRRMFLDPTLAQHRAALLLDGVAWTTARTYETLHHYQELATRYGYTQLGTGQRPWAMRSTRPRPQVAYR